MNIKEKNKYKLIAFLIPISVMLVISVYYGIFPFGDSTIMTVDMTNQYVSFFSYLKEIVMNPESVFYTFSKGLDGGMIGLMAYYLMSPINVIALFFSPKWMPVALYMITLIKIGLCGLTFYIYLRKDSYVYLIVSTAYSLTAYNIAYMSNIMWLDGIVLLPLIALGIDYIIENRNSYLYIGSLFLAIICNYYIGYMLCGFSVIYYGYKFIFEDTDKQVKKKISKTMKYIVASIVAGGLTAFLLIPVKTALVTTKGTMGITQMNWESNFSWRDFFSRYFIGAFDKQQIMNGAYPNIYCGIVILFFVVMFFIGKKNSKKEKLGAGLVLLLLILSMKINGLNLIWHGFSYPNWFNYRQSFILSFFIILFATKGLEQIGEWENKRNLLLCVLCINIGYLLMCIWVVQGEYTYINKDYVLFSIAVMILTGVCTLFYKRQYRMVIMGLFLIGVSELTMNAIVYIGNLSYTNFTNYQDIVKKMENPVEFIKQQDDTFYRMEKTFYRNQNDSMLLGYNGVSHYSSAQNRDILLLMGALGYRNHWNLWSYYNTGTTYANDSFFGIKYLISNTPKSYGYTEISSVDDLFIYQNEYTLPIGFMANDEIQDEKIENYSWYEGQNKLWSTLSSQYEDRIFEECEILNIETNDVDYAKDSNEYAAITILGDNPRIKYQVKMNRNAPLFGYFIVDEMQQQNVKILVNGKELGNYFTSYDYQILQLGEFLKDEIVEVEIQLNEMNLVLTEVCFFSQNMECFEKYYKELKNQSLKVTQFSNNRIKGVINSQGDKQMCLFTIPFDEGWTCYIDGKKVQIEKGFDHLIAIPVSKGEHRIEIEFIPVGLKTGIYISAIFLVLIGLSIVIQKGRKNES